MITCPKCNATLPDWAQTCQFCQTDVKAVTRPAAPVGAKPSLTNSLSPSWVPGAYYALCAFFIIEGAYDIFEAFALTKQKVMGQTIGWGFASYLGIAIGVFTAILGI